LLNCVLMSLLGYANHTDFVLENEWPKSWESKTFSRIY
jgi:hypothetical protein